MTRSYLRGGKFQLDEEYICYNKYEWEYLTEEQRTTARAASIEFFAVVLSKLPLPNLPLLHG